VLWLEKFLENTGADDEGTGTFKLSAHHRVAPLDDGAINRRSPKVGGSLIV